MALRKRHLWRLAIRPAAQNSFDRLPTSIKQSIFRRLRELLTAVDPYLDPNVQMLRKQQFERARKFRVNDYRVFFILTREPIEMSGHLYSGTFILLDIRNRKDAY